MAAKRIKESCSCGAKMEYSIEYTKAFSDDVRERQAKFHQQHSQCLYKK